MTAGVPGLDCPDTPAVIVLICLREVQGLTNRELFCPPIYKVSPGLLPA